jgi:DNA-binding transcriptional ArsR family regulator
MQTTSPAAVAEASLDVVFAALADPTRRAIIARLAAGEASVNELARPFDLSQPAISKHLQVLERAGLISRGQDAQRRPRRLEPERLKVLADWVGSYAHFWQESYQRLDDYLRELTPKHKEKPHDAKQARDRRRTR